MGQLLLIPDPRPLVERLGTQFFREAPERPGVYLMRDSADAVVYVGKAKNLRKRLASYRVANPERLRRRQLRLLRSVSRIELELCLDESDALTRESHLLRTLRPKFNRAGTWPGEPRFVSWQLTSEGLNFSVTNAVQPAWTFYGPLGTAAFLLRAALLRLIWCALHPDTGLRTLPHGWCRASRTPVFSLPIGRSAPEDLQKAADRLAAFARRDPEPLLDWIVERTATQQNRFETSFRELDLEVLRQTSRRRPDV